MEEKKETGTMKFPLGIQTFIKLGYPNHEATRWFMTLNKVSEEQQY